MKIADTSAQDVQLAPRSKRTRNLIGGGSILLLLIALWVAIPALNRWSSTSASVPYDRLRIAGSEGVLEVMGTEGRVRDERWVLREVNYRHHATSLCCDLTS